MEALQVREHCLMGDYASSAQLIPQVIWALTLSAHEYYQQVCKHSQLEPTSGAPRTARASLSMYMHMIALKMKLDLDGLPPQWNPQLAQHTTIEQHTTGCSKATDTKEQQTKHEPDPNQPPHPVPPPPYEPTHSGPTSSPTTTPSNYSNPKKVGFSLTFLMKAASVEAGTGSTSWAYQTTCVCAV